MNAQQPKVIIVGAGPVGLASSLELARFGVPSIVVEKHAGTSWHPKTRNFCTRTMEIARGWGRPVYERLRTIDTPDGWKSPIRFLMSATGEEFGLIESKGFEGPGPEVSPALPIMSSQERIESILVDAARASGLVDLRFGVTALRLVEGGEDDATRARLEVESADGGREILEGAAIVAADGASSPLREQLGVELQGHKGLQHLINCYFRADIESRIGDRTGVLLFVSNPNATGVLQPLDAQGRWLCQISVKAEDWSPEAFTHARAADWVRAAVGDEGLDVEILSVGFWKLNATVVERLVQGRVVFVGDAAHQFPPTGGLGVNTGLQGMHNAMWKLAYCVRGEAGWDLLTTYDTERRPVAAQITRQSLENSTNVVRIQAARLTGLETGLSPEQVVAESRRYGNHLGIEFGAAYASSAVIADGTSPPAVADSYSDYVQSATPGCRAPHLWVGPQNARFSTIDLIGPHFTLLAGPEAKDWCAQAAQASANLGVRIAIYQLGEAGLAPADGFAELYGTGPSGAVLVRPDGHVAWRAVSAPAPGGAADELADVLTAILARRLEAPAGGKLASAS